MASIRFAAAIEDMNLKDSNKVRLMLYLVIIAYILCVKGGLKDLKKIPKKNFKDKNTGFIRTRLSKSIFRKGYENVTHQAQKINDFIRFISKFISPHEQKNVQNCSFVQ